MVRHNTGISIDDRSTSDQVLGPYKDDGYEEALNFSGHVQGSYVHGLAVRDGTQVDVKMLSEDNHPIKDISEVGKSVRSAVASGFEDAVDGNVDVRLDLA